MQICQFLWSLDSPARCVLPGLEDELVVQRETRRGTSGRAHRGLHALYPLCTVYGVQDAEGRKLKQEHEQEQEEPEEVVLEPTRGRD